MFNPYFYIALLTHFLHQRLIVNAKTVCKNVSVRQNHFFQSLNNLQFVGVITKIILLTFNILYWVRNLRKKGFMVPPQLPLTIFLQFSAVRTILFLPNALTDVFVSRNAFIHSNLILSFNQFFYKMHVA